MAARSQAGTASGGVNAPERKFIGARLPEIVGL